MTAVEPIVVLSAVHLAVLTAVPGALAHALAIIAVAMAAAAIHLDLAAFAAVACTLARAATIWPA